MSDAQYQHGRTNQKRRTRSAILSGAESLLRQGKIPTIAEAADAASVSRATAYRYFTSQEHLLQELSLDTASRTVDVEIAQLADDSPPDERLNTVIKAIYRMVAGNNLALRTLLRLSVDPSSPTIDDPDNVPFRRGSRRIPWLEATLNPIMHELPAEQFRRLIMGLSLCTGIETQIVLRDICDLDEAEAEEVALWVADTLLKASLAPKS